MLRQRLIRFLLSFPLFWGGTTSAWASEMANIDPASDRMVWSPTALATPPQSFSFNTLDLGFWHFGFKINENWDVGFQTVPPLGFFAFGPTVRYRKEVKPGLSVGVFANAGFLYIFLFEDEFDDDDVDRSATYFGGGPMVSIGDQKRSINVSFLAYGGRAAGETGYMMFPSVGGNLQVSKRAKLNLEALTFFVPKADSYAEVWAVMYGIRLFGEHMYGDIAFLAPIGPDMGGIYKVAPLGIPVLGFGANW